ncbi:hypothetical protein AAFF_G00387030 [Aldrovandia affinis]|uniref:Uncharacterized protein n=1 Tax=Aldrovandia affinis TaxID=143900 RepID=A0AAD7SGP6_9TELE|nr:hypothetical protein AAFF_G00387030 [Aldrovandia affinis]
MTRRRAHSPQCHPSVPAVTVSHTPQYHRANWLFMGTHSPQCSWGGIGDPEGGRALEEGERAAAQPHKERVTGAQAPQRHAANTPVRLRPGPGERRTEQEETEGGGRGGCGPCRI